MRTLLLTVTLLLVSSGPGIAGARAICDDPPCSKRQIQAYERQVARHMMRTQQARFEAMARGEKKKSNRYDREFQRTQKRWMDAKHALATASN
jgi:hypothetical protein